MGLHKIDTTERRLPAVPVHQSGRIPSFWDSLKSLTEITYIEDLKECCISN